MQAAIRRRPCFTEDWLHVTVVFDPSLSPVGRPYVFLAESVLVVCLDVLEFVGPCTRLANPRPQVEVDTFC